MSKENHPNLNAVGFLTDIFVALESRVRGRAEKAAPIERIFLMNKIKHFVEEIDEALDQKFGV